MDLSEFFSGMVDAGGSGRGWRSPVAILCAVLGAIAGGMLTYDPADLLTFLGAIGTGALLGWVVGLFLRGFAVFLAIFLVILMAIYSWEWLMGGA